MAELKSCRVVVFLWMSSVPGHSISGFRKQMLLLISFFFFFSMLWPSEAPQAKAGAITWSLFLKSLNAWSLEKKMKGRNVLCPKWDLFGVLRWAGEDPTLKSVELDLRVQKELRSELAPRCFRRGRLPSTYEVRWGVVLDPLLGLRCVQDGWTAPRSRNPLGMFNSPESLALVWRIPWEPFHVSHAHTRERTHNIIKQSTINWLCFTHSIHPSIPQDASRSVESRQQLPVVLIYSGRSEGVQRGPWPLLGV